MNSKVIVIDGKTYNSVEEMPSDIRQKYEQAMGSLKDTNGDRIPDAFENANILEDQDKDGMPDVFESLSSMNTVASSMKIIIDGKEYNRIEDLPVDARARYEEAMGRMDANRNGFPDFVEGMLTATNPATTVPPKVGTGSARRPAPLPVNLTTTPDTSNGLMLALAGLFIFLLCVAGAGAVWYFFLR